MLKKTWLYFSQAATVVVAVMFVVTTLKPEWSGFRLVSSIVQVFEARPNPQGSAFGFSEASKRAMPAVVNIFTTQQVRLPAEHPLLDDPQFRKYFGEPEDPKDPKERSSSLGSGVIVSPQGYILTNHHVIESADEIEVALADGRKAIARVVGSDPETDIAVLKIDIKDPPSIVFGHVNQAQVGDMVLAIGNPFGVGQTVTMGIISALGRSHLGINTFENFIQTDAAINPGNSGGALVDAQGNLLGINTAIYSRSGGSLGIGFAIPANTARQVMEAIITTGAVVRGYIGVEPQDITPELAEAFKLPKQEGTIISGVMRGGPADKAGIKVGDILLKVGDAPVRDTTEMLNMIAQLQPEQNSKLLVLRNGKEVTADVKIGRRPTPPKMLRGREDEE
ncbi:MAG: trypsin-like peptidase domain-containing protein [Burkholderiales bacterium]|nr:trypsin-like peptidase domain-containing protein [Burkholderiales bacterium]